MTTKTAPAAEQIATVAADDFMRVVTNAVLSASTDDTLPMVCAIHFRPGNEPGTLMLEATNRYMASQEDIDLADLAEYDSDWSRAQVVKHMADDHGLKAPEGYDARTEAEVNKQHAALAHGPGDDLHTHTVRPMPVTELDCLVNARDLTKLVRTLKLVIEPETKTAVGRDRPHVVIEHKPGEDSYTGKVSFTLINNNGTDTTVSPRAVYGDYVKIDQLMADAVDSAKTIAFKIADQVSENLDEWITDAVKDAAEDPDAMIKLTRHIADRVADKLGDVQAVRASFNADYLQRFTKIDTGNKVDTVDIHLTAVGKPAYFTVGQRYRALLVPIRKG